MAKHIIELTVLDVPGQEGYRVGKVKNSTVHTPGDILKKDEVDRLCRSPIWDVSILPPKG